MKYILFSDFTQMFTQVQLFGAVAPDAFLNTLSDLVAALRVAKESNPTLSIHEISTLVKADAFTAFPDRMFSSLTDSDNTHLDEKGYVQINYGLDSRRYEIEMVHLHTTGQCFWLTFSYRDEYNEVGKLITKAQAVSEFI